MSPPPPSADELFWKAQELPEAERSAFLDEACGGDRSLRAEVLSLLAMSEEAGEDLHGAETGSFPIPSSEPEDVPLPETIGPYRVLGRIQVGGMGIVYRAQQDQPRREVAVKVLRTGLVTEETRRLFQTEIEVLGRLQHPGIAQIHDAGVATIDGAPLPYFAMELIDGRKLHEYVKEEGLGLRRKLELFVRVCQAIEHAHLRGIVHLDLKPSNVLVERDGQPKVLDFGIAHAVDPDLHLQHTTTSASLLGTLWYMSPEQARGGRLDVRSDVYSLGVVLYQMLANRLPHPLRPMAAQILRAIEEEEPEPLDRVLPEARGDVATVVHKCLEKDPERRYASAGELASDVVRHLRDEPILARPAAPWELWVKFARRHRALVGGVAATVLALVLGLMVSLRLLYLAHQAELGRQTAEEGMKTARADADFESDKLLALRDFERIGALLERAEDLHPALPGKAPDFELWLRDADELRVSFAQREAFLEQLRRERGRQEDGRWLFEDDTAQWLHDRYVALGAEFQTLLGDGGVHDDVADRLRRARNVRAETYEAYEQEWDECITEVLLHPLYNGLELEWQVGLVPLGPDPRSTLWEFWIPASGERPERDEDSGEFRVEAETGIVLVLIPPGRAQLGSQSGNPRGARYDPHRSTWERLRRVRLRPFLIGKYEITQAQWERLSGQRPSQHHEDRTVFPDITSGEFEVDTRQDDHPVESVSWSEATRFLHHAGLSLPTEAQWEYAARGDTITPWWFGSDEADLFERRAGNVADATALQTRSPPWWGPFSEHDDGHKLHHDVDGFTPNPWGLHGTIGNVAEWCSDWSDVDVSPSDIVERNGDGRRSIPEDMQRARTVKGGSFDQPFMRSRPSHRASRAAENRSDGIGFRAARRVTTAAREEREERDENDER